jgi:hypothetical protein
MAKLMYKPLGLLASVLGGMLAGAVFNRIWAMFAHRDDPPDATDADRSWKEVLPAAALHGAVFGLVKAAVARGGAAGVERATGTWPE